VDPATSQRYDEAFGGDIAYATLTDRVLGEIVGLLR
jgi:hypothetical protein